jgi:integrase/recombinase XerD
MEKIGDQPVWKITSADVLNYTTYLRTEYVPYTFAKPNPAHEVPTCKLSPKALRNLMRTHEDYFRQ